MNRELDRKKLVRILQYAHAGELGAARAYHGHWQAVTAPDEVEGIRRIEKEEWVHRAAVRRMLTVLGAEPLLPLEILIGTVGATLGALCPLSGWFFPMYFAGRLEFGNVDQYEDAAFHAERLGLKEMARELHAMTKTEREHELFFMNRVEGHPLLPFVQFVFNWGPLQRKAWAKKA
ncbi:MAG TPA: ferritin-like domain-containing protein [bacterium]|jgi:demethoxyubiquinone hydroxylase (CLK1/Coq7/Cat5 family)|nr:ferritin-like domain-containing protein [bacterium]